MKRQTLTLLLVLFMVKTGTAQTLHGLIKNESGQALPGVEISLLQTTRITTSDSSGTFQIRISRKKRKLRFYHPNYGTKVIRVKNEKQIRIVLKEKPDTMEVHDREELHAKDIEASHQGNLFEALQGKIAGLQINPSNGQVGSNAQLLMRGYTSIHFRESPLIIIDGMPVDNNLDAHDLRGTPATNRAMDINPDNIQSVSVLRGGAAAAHYGMRAANGAILITTKDGSNTEGLTISYDFTASIDQINQLPETTSAFTRGRNGEYSNVTHWSWGPAYASNPLFPWGTMLDLDGDGTRENLSDQPIPQYPDNYRRFWQNGNSQRHQLEVSGSKAQKSFFASLGHLRQNGVITNQNYQRRNLLFQGRQQLNPDLEIRLGARYIHSGGKRFRTASGLTDGLAYWQPLWDVEHFPWKDSLGQKTWFSDMIPHPRWVVEEEGEDWNLNRFVSTLGLEWSLSDRWKLHFRSGLDRYLEKREEIRPPGSVSTAGAGGDLSIARFNQLNVNIDVFAEGTLWSAESLQIETRTGLNFYHTHSEDFYSLGRTFVLPGLFNLENTEEQETETVLENRSLSGLFTQLNFQYEKWLYLKLGGRGDWSSALGSRLNIYPSASAMLVWTEGLSSSLLSFGNLRLAWAKTGNLPAAERVRSVFERQQPDLFDALSYSLENLFEKAGLIPETSQDFEIGSNLHFLDHNLGFDINFYHRKSTNQILLKEISPGQEYQIVQQGRLINRGVELALYLPRTLKWGHWQWEAELTFYTNNSKLGDLKGLGVDSTGVLQGGGYWSTAQIRALDGQAYGAVYGFHYSRFGDLPPDHPNYLGQPFLIDEDGHPIRQLDRVLLGNTMPDWVMSLHSRIEYRNLSLGFLLERRRGGVVINGMKGHLVNTGQAMLTENRWYADADPYANARMVFEGISEDGNPNELAATLDNNYYSNTWARTDENLAEDGSWWRLRYIYFMYKIPIEGKKMKFLSEISVRLTIRNAWLLTKYSGIDPEVNALGALELPGYDEASVPNTRSWEIGFSVKF